MSKMTKAEYRAEYKEMKRMVMPYIKKHAYLAQACQCVPYTMSVYAVRIFGRVFRGAGVSKCIATDVWSPTQGSNRAEGRAMGELIARVTRYAVRHDMAAYAAGIVEEA